MSPYWLAVAWLPYETDQRRLVRHCRFRNSELLFGARQAAGELWRDFPVAELELTLKGFEVDAFDWESYLLVSRRLREAMALGPAEVQYLEVDDSASIPEVRARGYQILNIVAQESVADPKASDYDLGRLTPDSPEMVLRVGGIALRPDAQADHELFRDRLFLGFQFASDALAMRVLRAGCTGLRFFDPARFDFGPGVPYRTLRGVEREVVRDALGEVIEPELIEAIH
ncbi:hypothetical protein QO010_001187 [Caulobacter ginsengisoli]|uniref:Immunity MXAN-0049 protein domain-containing protein n=1 Tax=Caulobacter ginsengisoli TaxID=400775 RepID=A0ABU0IN35_9CAUL|nr:DUF1629 domain-containing protein [Caulobacter ginsengisoli]MDQ0463416.1 hypothetical protein [Caulobacter ginsengisoli]